MSDQGTTEWLADRAGKATASRFKDILAKIKTGEAATRRNYKMQLVTERLTGLPVETYKNSAMEWGTAQEPLARLAYESQHKELVQQQGFLTHLTVDAGCSPDGLIGTDGGLEIKCPFSSLVHVETLLGKMPTEHMAQIQGAMWITGRKWWSFVSFDPRLPEHLQLYVQRIDRDDIYIQNLGAEVLKFLKEVQDLQAQLMEAGNVRTETRPRLAV